MPVSTRHNYGFPLGFGTLGGLMKRLLFLVFGVICAWFFVFVFGFADPSQFPEPWVWVIIPSAFTLAITCFAGAVMSPSDKFEWQLLFLFGMAVAGLNATFTCFFTFLVKFKDGGNSGRLSGGNSHFGLAHFSFLGS